MPPSATKIISSRVLSEILAIFFLYLISLTFFMVMIVLFREVKEQAGLPWAKIPVLIPLMLPFSQFLAVPVVMLLTVVTVYSRMNVAREIIALQTSGIPAFRVILPTLIFGLVMSVYTMAMYELNASWGMRQMKRVFLSASQDILYNQLRGPEKSITFDSEQITLSVASVDGKILREPVIARKGRNGAPAFTITAREAIIEVGSWEELKPGSGVRNPLENLYSPEDYKEGVVKITFSEVHSGVQAGNILIPEKQIVIVPLSEMPLFQSREGQRATETPIWELPKLVDERTEAIREVRSEMCLEGTRQLILGDFGDFGDEKWTQFHRRLRSYEDDVARARLQPHYRGALGFSCFCFALIGAPLAVWKGKYGALQLIATAFLPLLVLYYPLTMRLLLVVKGGQVPPEVMWLPNVALVVLGVWLLRRAG